LALLLLPPFAGVNTIAGVSVLAMVVGVAEVVIV
jgi:hypothetical protein